jgi:hypothetical protein
MASREEWIAFVKALRGRQDKLREEARPYEECRIFIGPLPSGGRSEVTEKYIASIKEDIASLERTIQRVIAEEGLPPDS